MFQSYDFEYLGINAISTTVHVYRFNCIIVDSDFEERTDVITGAYECGPGIVAGIAAINIYEKRNLNVAANLIKVFHYYSSRWGNSFNSIIEANKKNSPRFTKYENDLQKYLVLI